MGQGNGAPAVWPLFIRILFGFLFEVYDLPAFQGPTTHKFKVAMKFLFPWPRRAEASQQSRFSSPRSAPSARLTAPLWGARASVLTPCPFQTRQNGPGGNPHALSGCTTCTQHYLQDSEQPPGKWAGPLFKVLLSADDTQRGSGVRPAPTNLKIQ